MKARPGNPLAKAQKKDPEAIFAKQADEVSPAVGRSADEAYGDSPIAMALLREVRRDKNLGRRPRPSSAAIVLPAQAGDYRRSLLDKIASLVDQNAFGRSEMCVQFAILLERALTAMGTAARALHGPAHYLRESGEWVAWPDHAWVVTDGGALIDGNIDSVVENPVMGRGLSPKSYWGPKAECPGDRRFPEGERAALDPNDADDVEKWWAALESWMRTKGLLKKPSTNDAASG